MTLSFPPRSSADLVGLIGWKTRGLTVLVSGIAVVLGLVLVNWLQPGAGVDPGVAEQLLSEGAESAQAIVSGSRDAPPGLNLLPSILPAHAVGPAAHNGILAVMFVTLVVGVGRTETRRVGKGGGRTGR